MAPEQANKLKKVFTLAITAVKAEQAVRGIAGRCMTPTPKEAEFMRLHKRAIEELEAGTFEMASFEKSLWKHYDKWQDFGEGGITSPPMPEGGEFVTPKPPKS